MDIVASNNCVYQASVLSQASFKHVFSESAPLTSRRTAYKSDIDRHISRQLLLRSGMISTTSRSLGYSCRGRAANCLKETAHDIQKSEYPKLCKRVSNFRTSYRRHQCSRFLQYCRQLPKIASKIESPVQLISNDGNIQPKHEVHSRWTRQQREPLSFETSVGQPVPQPRTLAEIAFADRALLFLGFIACAVTGALSLLLLSAIPALQAIKRAAEEVERLAVVAKEEIPATMAAVRLSGMEISDLTVELSDLSQEITGGIRSSARAVAATEDAIRRVGSFASSSTRSMLQARAGMAGSSLLPKHGDVVSRLPPLAQAAQGSRIAVASLRQAGHEVGKLSRIWQWIDKSSKFRRKDGNQPTASKPNQTTKAQST